MRENRTSGSMSGDGKQRPQLGRRRKGESRRQATPATYGHRAHPRLYRFSTPSFGTGETTQNVQGWPRRALTKHGERRQGARRTAETACCADDSSRPRARRFRVARSGRATDFDDREMLAAGAVADVEFQRHAGPTANQRLRSGARRAPGPLGASARIAGLARKKLSGCYNNRGSPEVEFDYHLPSQTFTFRTRGSRWTAEPEIPTFSAHIVANGRVFVRRKHGRALPWRDSPNGCTGPARVGAGSRGLRTGARPDSRASDRRQLGTWHR